MSILVKRYDAITLPKQATKTDEGYLKATLRCTRTGVFLYSKADGGIFREYRPIEEVSAQESVNSLKGKPVTNDHPLERKVSADNASDLMRGFTGETAELDTEKYLCVNGTITDAALVSDIEMGKVELSCGYDCELDMTPGISPQGERYDAVQRNIRYNHVAVVDRGRAGREARIRMDSDFKLLEDAVIKVTMNDGSVIEVSTQADADKLIASQRTAKVDAEKATAAAAQLSTLQGKHDGLDAKVKELEGKLGQTATDEEAKKIQAKQDAAVSERVSLLVTANKFMPAEKQASLIKLDSQGIMRAVLMEKNPELKLDGKTPEYIAARFEVLTETTVVKSDADVNGEELGAAILDARADEEMAGEGEEDEAMKRDRERKDKAANRWKEPLDGKKK